MAPYAWIPDGAKVGEIKTPPFSLAARIEAGISAETTTKKVIETCKARLKAYDDLMRGE